jgi:hypothetical protein
VSTTARATRALDDEQVREGRSCFVLEEQSWGIGGSRARC